MKKILFFMGWLMSASLYSQSELNVFQDWITTAGTQHFFYRNVTRTDGSGNVYVAGATQTAAGDYDILLAKYNSSGVQQWIRQIDGAAHYQDFATSIQLDGSGNVYITGAITNDTVSRLSDLIVVKYNSGGTEQWRATYDGANLYDCGTDIYVTSGGSVVVVGSSYNSSVNLDFISLAYNSSGVQQFATRYDHSSSMNDVPVRITKLGSSTYVSGAVQTGTGTYDWAEVKYNNSGVQQALKTSTGGTTGIEEVHAMVQDAGGNLYLAGITPTLSNGYDYDLIKLDSSLNIVWERTYDGTDHLNDIANGVQVSASGDVYVTGASRTTTSGDDYLTLKYNSSGTLIWSRTFNDSLNGDDVASAVAIDNSGKIIVTGSALTDSLNNLNYYTIKYDTAGTVEWNIVFDGDKHLNDRATTIAIDTVGAIVVTGASETAAGVFEYATVKYVEKDIITPTDFLGEKPQSHFLYYENKGQLINTDTSLIPQVRYYTTNTYPRYYFMNDTTSIVFSKVDTIAATSDTLHRIDLSFTNHNENLKIYSLEQKDSYSNYFLAHCPDGVTEIYGNAKLVTPDLYENIDLMYSSNQNGFKYYFIVKPGGNPSDIRMQFTGASSTNLSSNVLTLNSSIGSISFDRAFTYQIDNNNDTITNSDQYANWHNYTGDKYGVDVHSYDSTKVMIIQVDAGNTSSSFPAIVSLEWSTYYGGGGEEFSDVKTDGVGNSYYTGYTGSAGFPTLSGLQTLFGGGPFSATDMVILKFNPVGTLTWATYYGGSGDDLGNAIGIDNQQNVWVVGYAGANFPLQEADPVGSSDFFQSTHGGGYDAAIVKLTSDGTTKLWATYYGDIDTDHAIDLAFDKYNNVYIVGDAGAASSLTLHTQTGGYNSTAGNGLIMKFSLDAVPLWITRLGGTATSCGVSSVCTDALGNVYVSGSINSGTGFPIQNNGANGTYGGGAHDGFAMRFDNHPANNALNWSTYYGGTGTDAIQSIACDGNSRIFFTGNTNSPNTSFPLADPSITSWDYYQSNYGGGMYDLCVGYFDPSGTLMWSTYYGDTGNEAVGDVCTDSDNNIYVTGVSYDGNFPFPSPNLPNGYIQSYNGGDEAFILGFNSVLHPIWATYYGGSNNERQFGSTCYSNQKLYITGGTESSDISFPLVAPTSAYSQPYANYSDGYIARFDLTPVIIISTDDVAETANYFNVFPVPSNDLININVTGINNSFVSISIVNSLGQEVIKEMFKEVHYTLEKQYSLHNFTKGIYIVNVAVDGKVQTKKIIIQ